MNNVGLPGVGGSLGRCSVCEKPFLKSILLGGDCVPFTLGCIEQQMYAHDDCIETLKAAVVDDEKSSLNGEVHPYFLPDSQLRELLLEYIDTKSIY